MPQVEQKIGEGEIQTKHCKKCGQVKTLNRFSVSSGEPDGKRRECKDCVAEYMKKYNARKRAAKAADPVKKKAPKREPVRAPADEHLKGSADDMLMKRIKCTLWITDYGDEVANEFEAVAGELKSDAQLYEISDALEARLAKRKDEAWKEEFLREEGKKDAEV